MSDAALSLSASLEDYLEAIFHIVQEKQAARPKDICKRLKVASSSVTGALKTLAERQLVRYAPYDVVTLTDAGEEAARDVVHRHETLRRFFITVLASDPELAEEAACRMEHAVPAEMVERFIRFLHFVEQCPQGGPGLIEGFRVHLEQGCRPDCFHRCPLSSPTEAAEPTLAELQPGQRATVTRVRGEGTLRRRLMDLGVIAGAPVTMERSAPLGDPLEVLVSGTHLSLRRQEAAAVQISLAE